MLSLSLFPEADSDADYPGVGGVGIPKFEIRNSKYLRVAGGIPSSEFLTWVAGVADSNQMC
jgi:hypothetical protein